MRFDAAQRKLLLDSVERLARDHIAARMSQIDRSDEFPWDVYKRQADLGLFALWVPEEYGGAGADLLTILLVAERMARVSGSSALTFSNCGDGTMPLVVGGSERIKREYLPRIATGEVIPCYALTEPGAGSDAAAIITRARRVEGGYRITGRKIFCTNGSIGHVFTVFATLDPALGRKGIGAFVVPAGAEGLSIGHDEDLIGLRGSPASEVVFDDVFVPEDARLGAEDEGFKIAMAGLDEARLSACAMSIGIARGATVLALEQARQRVAFGKPIVEHQGIQFLLADMATEIAAAWALTEKAVSVTERRPGREASTYVAMAKLFATDACMHATTEAVQIFGGSGLSRELPVERMMRDAKAFQIFDGTNQIQRMIIGRQLQFSGLPDDADWIME
ncbi:MAG: acyl-CoA dehydrogenase [Chloroflexota bacterium]|jgi:alkylation response protein AidB-like acyl-CoA dehydrogenase|nr:acyl-CoA dehydrogenase [Chloroflexota bacterium]